MNIGICDNCESDIRELRELIFKSNALKNCSIIEFTNPLELLEKIENWHFDVVFLDIDMPEMNGIGLGRKIRDLSDEIYIIFVTSYPQYAIEAFDLDAFRFLLKPLDAEKAEKVFLSLAEVIRKNNIAFSVKTKSGYISIPIREIEYVEYVRRYVTVHTKDKEYSYPGLISDAYDFLYEYDFQMINQGEIVNMRKIFQIDRTSVTLETGKVLEISQRKRSEVLSRYTEYIGDN